MGVGMDWVHIGIETGTLDGVGHRGPRGRYWNWEWMFGKTKKSLDGVVCGSDGKGGGSPWSPWNSDHVGTVSRR